ncbi:hypothetical protein [Pseudoxanthomonas koreensis]|uniref:hypothetical protein n=1 Tax=Pseudoxanthomonas koreensis TaxID=266061 RepID=UPI0035A705C2
MSADPVVVRLRWAAALALLGLVAWLVVLAGVGSRAPGLPAAGQAAVPALPALDAGEGWRLEPPEAYAGIAARPVFTTDRQPSAFVMTMPAGGGTAAGLRLTGVVIGDAFAMATLTRSDGNTLHLREGGDAVSGWRLLELASGMATLEGPAGIQTLVLQPVDVPAAAAHASAGDRPPGADDGPRAGATASTGPARSSGDPGMQWNAGTAPAAGGPGDSGAAGPGSVAAAGAVGSAGGRLPQVPAQGPGGVPAMPGLPGGATMPDPSMAPSFGWDVPVSMPGVVQEELARSTRDRIQSERNRLRQLRDRRDDD